MNLRRLISWLLPHGLVVWLSAWRERAAARDPSYRKYCGSNDQIRGRHAGGRCFILGNGPSINSQNLALLQGEFVISVSSGYHHKDYQLIAPRYHCVPQITYGTMTPDDVARWFVEMDARLGNAELFLSHTEAELVRSHGLFAGRTVRYVCFAGEFSQTDTRPVDLGAPMPGVQSVSIMALVVAMYLGFREIYLLGVEHDHFRTGRYDYFYKPTVLRGKDVFVAPDGAIRSLYDEFEALRTLWGQYRRMRLIAEANSISILNATAGGALDEFPRVEFESLFASAERGKAAR